MAVATPDPIFPSYKSGVFRVTSDLFVTTRESEVVKDVSEYLVNAEITGDIDRPASKYRFEGSLYDEVVQDGDWVMPVQEYVPEAGDIIRSQMGLYLLEPPTITYNGRREADTKFRGHDVVELLDRSALLDTFYTPIDGNVMSDIELAIRMLGITSMGPNLLTNGGFEQEATGWVVSNSNVSPTQSWTDSQFPTPEGVKMWRPLIPPNTPIGAHTLLYSPLIPVPNGATKLMMSGLKNGGGRHAGFGYIDFQDAAGVHMNARMYLGSFNTPNAYSDVWERLVAVGDVPEGAATFKVTVHVQTLAVSTTSTLSTRWDDVQVRECTGDLLPRSMIALPPSAKVATTRIQHLTGDTRLSAVNDRLTAIGHHAIHARLDGKMISRPSRDIASDTAARVYDAGTDNRIVSVINIEPSATERFNTFIAIKEDLTSGTVMRSIVYNDDRSDPWSIHGTFGQMAKVIPVQDATSVADLTAAAEAARDRSSIQEQLTMSVLPDPTLAVHDVIEIIGGGRAEGRWSVENIEWSLDSEDPLVSISARRTIKSGGQT